MTLRRFVPLAVLMVAGGLVLAQPPAKKEPAPKAKAPAAGGLEDTLDKALRNSADIKVAEAKVRDAEAQLNQVRHQVLTKVTALHNDLTIAKRMLELAEVNLAQLQKSAANADIMAMLTAKVTVEKQRGEVEKLDAELKSLRGEFAVKNLAALLGGDLVGGDDLAVRAWLRAGKMPIAEEAPRPAEIHATMAERISKFLDTEIEWSNKSPTIAKIVAEPELPLEEVVNALRTATDTEVPTRLGENTGDFRLRNNFKGKITVGAMLQALEDSMPDLKIVVRDYGILFVTAQEVPEGAIRVKDFWKNIPKV